MDIDSSTLIIGVISLLFFILPIYYFEYYKKRPSKKFTAFFQNTAEKNGLKLSQFDIWGDHYGIGIDRNANKLLYIKQKNGQDEITVINLKEVKKGGISKADDPQKGLARINLLIEYSKSGKPQHTLEMFNGGEGGILRDEAVLAEKWLKIINSKSAAR